MAENVAELVGEHRQQVHLPISSTAGCCNQVSRRICELGVVRRSRIDEPAVLGRVHVDSDHRAGCLGEGQSSEVRDRQRDCGEVLTRPVGLGMLEDGPHLIDRDGCGHRNGRGNVSGDQLTGFSSQSRRRREQSGGCRHGQERDEHASSYTSDGSAVASQRPTSRAFPFTPAASHSAPLRLNHATLTHPSHGARGKSGIFPQEVCGPIFAARRLPEIDAFPGAGPWSDILEASCPPNWDDASRSDSPVSR